MNLRSSPTTWQAFRSSECAVWSNHIKLDNHRTSCVAVALVPAPTREANNVLPAVVIGVRRRRGARGDIWGAPVVMNACVATCKSNPDCRSFTTWQKSTNDGSAGCWVKSTVVTATERANMAATHGLSGRNCHTHMKWHAPVQQFRQLQAFRLQLH